MSHWHSGRAPTREEVLAELARVLASRRNARASPFVLTPALLGASEADAKGIDALQAAHDFIGEKWPRT